jgi:hypothetical protein
LDDGSLSWRRTNSTQINWTYWKYAGAFSRMRHFSVLDLDLDSGRMKSSAYLESPTEKKKIKDQDQDLKR